MSEEQVIQGELEELRRLWKLHPDMRGLIEKRAHELKCTREQCKNPRRSYESYVCRSHVVNYSDRTGDRSSNFTVEEIQQRILSWRTSEQESFNYE